MTSRADERRPSVEVERRGDALWARIARPEHGNACSPHVIDGLWDWLGRADGTGLRALVLTGSGSSFCAGADMHIGAQHLDDPQELLAYIRRGRDLVDAVADAPLPVVAAVNGIALAGGLELVLAADIVVAARSARLGDAHSRFSVVPGWGSTARLPRIVGRRAATYLLLTGAILGAEEMHRLGLVTQVVDDAELDARVAEMVESLPSDPGTRTRFTRLARAGAEGPLREALDREWLALVEHVEQPEFAAGVRRFLAR